MFRAKSILIIICCFQFCAIKAADIDTDSLQQLLPITTQPSERIKILNLLAKENIGKDLFKANQFAEQALFISESINLREGKGEALYYIALFNFGHRNYEKSLNYLQESFQELEYLNDDRWNAKISFAMGQVYHRRFEYEKSLEALFAAMNIFKEMDAGKRLAETFNQIGMIYYEQENYDKAFEYYSNSLSIMVSIGERPGMAKLFNNIGEIYMFNKNYGKALEFFNKAIKINLELPNIDFLAMNYNNLGNVFMENQNYESSMHYFSKALKIVERSKNEELPPIINNSLGNLYLQMEKLTLAYHHFSVAFKFAQENKNLIYIRNSLKGLSKLFEKQNNSKLAYEYYQQFKIISDSIVQRNNSEKITLLEMKFIFEQEQKIKRVQQQKKIIKYLVIAGGLLIILLTFVLLYGRLRVKAQRAMIEADNLQLEKTQLREKIDYKNRELTTIVMYLVKKNEFINFISDKLFKAKSKFKKTNQKNVEEIIINLQSNIDNDIWDVFEKRFSEVHLQFYDRINQNFPILTDMDKRLCALLRLNLSTKEIAAIVHQSPKSIEVARTRIRKKLNLSNTDVNLNTFLAKL